MKKLISIITLVLYLTVTLAGGFSAMASTEGGSITPDDFSPLYYYFTAFDRAVDLSVSSASLGGKVTRITDESGNGAARFYAEEGAKSDGYADISFLNGGVDAEEYVMEADITPVTLSSSSEVRVFDTKGVAKSDPNHSKWRLGSGFSSNGKIYSYCTSKGTRVQVGTWESGKTYRISHVYYNGGSSYDVYINGSVAATGLGCEAVTPSYARIDMYKSTTAGELEFYVDNCGVYSGTQLLNTEEYSVFTYSSNSYNKQINMSTTSTKGGTIEHAFLDGDGVGHFYTEAGEKSSSYADVNVPAIGSQSDYIVEIEITPVTLDSGSYIGIFDAKDANGSWRLGGRMNSDGTIRIRKDNSSLVTVGNWTANTPVFISYAYHCAEGKYDTYINGKLVAKDIPCPTINPYIFRIDMANSGSGVIDFYLDDCRVYEGTVLLGNDCFDESVVSVMDNEAMAKRLLNESDGAYSIFSSYYYANGSKYNYPSADCQPICVNEEAYVSAGFLSDILGLSDAQGIIEASPDVHTVESVSYIPAHEVASVMGKSYLFDPRGYFIFSEEPFEYVDSAHFISMYEPADYIYRYLCFANPKGSQFLEDFKANTPRGKHPRLIYTREDVEYMKALAEEDSLWESRLRNVISTADSDLKTYANRFTVDCPDDKKQSQTTTLQTVMENLSLAYLLTGDTKYADEGIRHMKTICQWETLGWQVANLTTGHWAMSIAIGYDTFYDYMMSTPEGQADMQFIKDAIIRLPFADTIRAYSGGGGVHWITIRDNFMGVIGGALMSLVIALADEEDIQDQISYLSENVIKSLEIATTLYYPNGGYFEGVTYSSYMLGNLSYGMEALWKCCGTDYDLGLARGFSEAGAFFVHMQSTKSKMNFHDCGSGFTTSKIPFWLAYRYGEDDIARLWRHQNQLRGSGNDVPSMFFGYKSGTYEASAHGAPLDYYFPTTETGSFRSSFDTAVQNFVGFHGGRNGLTHDMLDLGEFIYEADGVQWAIDLGGDNYDLPSYFGTAGYKIYRKNPQGENCLVINPQANQDAEGNMTWYGQKLKALAPLTLFESAPKAAMSAYDLTDAYERDVTSYTRGYYFGDDRNALTIQDELTLKDTSEIYWFMHTRAKIEIVDATTARLTQDGKSLTAKLLCSEEDVVFKSMEAEPLPGSPIVEGQAVNTGVTKLTVHIPRASGDVKIAVKLSPDNEFYSVTALEDVDIADWTLPEGDIVYENVIANARVNRTNLFSADVQLDDNVKSAKLYIDGQYVDDVELLDEIRYSTDCYDVSYLEEGTHIARLDLTFKDSGTASLQDVFTCTDNDSELFYQNTLSGYKGSSISTPTGWTLSKTGTVGTDPRGDGFTLVANGAEQIWLDYRGANKYAVSDAAVVVEFDIKFSETTGHFEIECKNSAGNWYMHNISFFNNGTLYNNLEYEAGKTYHVRFIADTVYREASVYVDDTVVCHVTDIEAAYDLTTLKLQYTAATAGASVTYSNFVVSKYAEKTSPVKVRLDKAGNSLKLNLQSDNPDGKYSVYVAHYEGNRMISVLPLRGGDGYSGYISVPRGAEYTKVFVFDKDSKIRPVSGVHYYRNEG